MASLPAAYLVLRYAQVARSAARVARQKFGNAPAALPAHIVAPKTPPRRRKSAHSAKKANRMPYHRFETPQSTALGYVARSEHFLTLAWRVERWSPGDRCCRHVLVEYHYPHACFDARIGHDAFLELKAVVDEGRSIGVAVNALLRHHLVAPHLLVYQNHGGECRLLRPYRRKIAHAYRLLTPRGARGAVRALEIHNHLVRNDIVAHWYVHEPHRERAHHLPDA